MVDVVSDAVLVVVFECMVSEGILTVVDAVTDFVVVCCVLTMVDIAIDVVLVVVFNCVVLSGVSGVVTVAVELPKMQLSLFPASQPVRGI